MKKNLWIFAVLFLVLLSPACAGASGEPMGIWQFAADEIVIDADAQAYTITFDKTLYGAAVYAVSYSEETDAFTPEETLFEREKINAGECLTVRAYMPEIIPTLIIAGVTEDGETLCLSLCESGENGAPLLVPVSLSRVSAQQALGLIYALLGEESPETGFSYSIGLEEETWLDGALYWNFRVSWLVTDESGSAHLSYLTNLAVSQTDGRILGADMSNGQWTTYEIGETGVR